MTFAVKTCDVVGCHSHKGRYGYSLRRGMTLGPYLNSWKQDGASLPKRKGDPVNMKLRGVSELPRLEAGRKCEKGEHDRLQSAVVGRNRKH